MKDSWTQLIEKGELSLGVPCAPFQLTHFFVTDGDVHKEQQVVIGCKFPLKEIRQKLLKKQERYMRLKSDQEINEMTDEELAPQLSPMNMDCSSEDKKEMYKQYQCTRSLAMWHDHGTVLGLGVVMITIHIVYDREVFYTQAELESNEAKSQVSVQATVESLEIHILIACSSAVDDQAAIIQDRVDCLLSLSEPLTTSGGIEIADELLFFVGDHPAQQFERGTQGGGTYKCRGCDVMMDDLAHTANTPTKPLRLTTNSYFRKIG